MPAGRPGGELDLGLPVSIAGKYEKYTIFRHRVVVEECPVLQMSNFGVWKPEFLLFLP